MSITRLLIALLFMNTAFTALSAFAAIPHNIWEPPFYNGVAVQVDKKLITYDDLRREMAPLIAKIRAQAKDEAEFETQINDLYEQTVNTLTERALLITEFNTRGYKIPAKEIDMEYRKVLKENFDGKMSDMVAVLQQQGLTLPAYRKQLEENIMVASLQSRFRHELPEITPDQVSAYYKTNPEKFAQESSAKLSVITLKPITDEPVDVLVQNATALRQNIIEGEDFDKVAAQNNQEGNVDWGYLSTKDLSSEIAEALESVKTGELSQPVVIDGKVLLVKVVDRKNQDVAPLESVREQIKNALANEQGMAAYTKWIDQLKKKYFVKITDLQ